jgi:hypothetical protein
MRNPVRNSLGKKDGLALLPVDLSRVSKLVAMIVRILDVSLDAARVRLTKLDILPSVL